MIPVCRKGFRVIKNVAVADCAGKRNSTVLALLVNGIYGSTYKRQCFSHYNSHAKECNIVLGPYQRQAINEYVVSHKTPGNHQTLQDVIKRRNFHTSSCLKSHEDLQKEEKREARILIWMCIAMIAIIGTAYSFIDHEEYDRPTVEKS